MGEDGSSREPVQRRILVVEDEPGMQRAIRAVLDGWRVVPALDLGAARASMGERIDVAVIDKNLPDGNGLDFARDLRTRYPELPVIVLTGYPTMDTAIQAARLGVYDFITKPFDGPALRDRIESAYRRAEIERERSQLADELVATDARYRQLVDASADAILMVDEGSGMIHAANPAASALFGIPVTQMIGMDARRAMGAGEGLELEVTSGKTMLGGRKMRVDVIRDQTRRRALEERVRRAEALELVGQLAGGFAHDFNNLLVVLYAAADQLRSVTRTMPDPDAATATKWLNEIRATSDRAADLARRMLGMSRGPVGATEIIDVNEVLADARTLLERTIEANVRLTIEPGTDVPLVKMGRGALEQVLLNLALNARDAMPRGGTLTIESKRVEENGRARARLVVRDTGIGMSAAVRAQIFEPFFTTKGPVRGTGLGLATVQRVITDVGGAITVASEPGAGATFTVELPAARGAKTTGRWHSLPPAEAAKTGERILVLEDHPAVRASIDRMLTTAGYEVHAVATGQAARAESEAHAFDLIIADMMVPDANGIEMIGELCGVAPDRRRRAIVISGYGTAGVGDQGTPLADLDFVAKPFTTDQLLTKVREVLDRV